nr:unnamed protein product [Callosobruchus chinensis]
MEKFNWTGEDTCLLIENFELYPELWNVHNVAKKRSVKDKRSSGLIACRIFVSFLLILSLTK